MLGVRDGARSMEISSATANLATGTGAWMATGAEGPGAEAWPIWQTWQAASSEAVLCQWVAASVASATTARTIATASRRWSVFFDNIFTLGLNPSRAAILTRMWRRRQRFRLALCQFIDVREFSVSLLPRHADAIVERGGSVLFDWDLKADRGGVELGCGEV
jgi:hypothetical protein